MMLFLAKLLLFTLFHVSGQATWSSPEGQQPLLNRDSNPYPRLNFSSSAPLIFHSTFSLLQQWPNTFYPNGHVVAPCTIPKHTNLYHAHNNESFPPSPEWFAFDASMAYSILGGLSNSHLLTFRTTQDVSCLYFDGESASLMHPGTMDSQMLVIHNSSIHIPDHPRFDWPSRPYRPNDTHPPGHDYPRPPPGFDPLQAEYDRADGLCNFIIEKHLGGPGWGYEAIIRMNAAFEVIWCNFTSPSAQLISWLNVSAPRMDGTSDPSKVDTLLYHDMPRKPPRRGRPGTGWFDQPFRGRSAYEWFLSATKTFGFHANSPGRGEARVKVESCGLFTFYDEALQDQARVRVDSERQSLNLTKQGFWQNPSDARDREAALQKLSRRRRTQRTMNVSIADGHYMRKEPEQRMRNTLSRSESCSGIDWVLTTQTIVADYSADLYELKSLLAGVPESDNSTLHRNHLGAVRGLAHHLYMPYYQYPSSIPGSSEDSLSPYHSSSLAALKRCQSQHEVLSGSKDVLSRSELTTSAAITHVLSGICTTLLPIFLSTESLWPRNFNNATQIPALTEPLQTEIRQTHLENLSNLKELMAWLGWEEQWTTCSPGCEIGQVCAIPIWPVMGIGHFAGPDGKGSWGRRGDGDEWLETKCVDAGHLW